MNKRAQQFQLSRRTALGFGAAGAGIALGVSRPGSAAAAPPPNTGTWIGPVPTPLLVSQDPTNGPSLRSGANVNDYFTNVHGSAYRVHEEGFSTDNSHLYYMVGTDSQIRRTYIEIAGGSQGSKQRVEWESRDDANHSSTYHTSQWRSFAFRVTGEYPNENGSWSNIDQWHHRPDNGDIDGPQPFGMGVGADGLKIFARHDASQIRPADGYWEQVALHIPSLPLNQWNRIVYHLGFCRGKFDPNGAGFLRIWMNGHKLYEDWNCRIGYNDTNGNYHKFGYYRSRSAKSTQVEFANSRISLNNGASLEGYVNTPEALPYGSAPTDVPFAWSEWVRDNSVPRYVSDRTYRLQKGGGTEHEVKWYNAYTSNQYGRERFRVGLSNLASLPGGQCAEWASNSISGNTIWRAFYVRRRPGLGLITPAWTIVDRLQYASGSDYEHPLSIQIDGSPTPNLIVKTGSNWGNTSWNSFAMSSGPQGVGWNSVVYRISKSTSPGASNGTLQLWLNGVQRINQTGLAVGDSTPVLHVYGLNRQNQAGSSEIEFANQELYSNGASLQSWAVTNPYVGDTPSRAQANYG